MISERDSRGRGIALIAKIRRSAVPLVLGGEPPRGQAEDADSVGEYREPRGSYFPSVLY